MSSVVAAIDGVISQLAQLVDKPHYDYESFVLCSGWLVTGFETWVYRRQIRTYELKKPPPEVAEHLPQELYDKAQAYGLDKTRYSLLKTVFDQILTFLSIRFEITHSLLWVSFLTLLSTIPSLPWSYYYTFVIEERHGFNKQTVKLWVTDQIKSTAIMAAIGLPFLAGFLKIIELAGKNFVPWLMLFISFTQPSVGPICKSMLTPVQPLFNKLTPLPAGDLRDRTEKLANMLGFPLKHLYQIDGSKRSSHSNAYFYGLPWSKHIVIYDTLMEKSSAAEVEAVLGHELGHWYYSHPTKLMAVGQSHLFFILTVFSIFIHNTALYRSFHFDPRLATRNPAGGPQPIMIGFMLFQMVLEPLDTVVKFGMNAITRKYEYQADEFAVELEKKEELKDALIKLHITNLSSPHNDSLYSAYHHSHPTLPERLRAMDLYKPNRNLTLRSEKKEL